MAYRTSALPVGWRVEELGSLCQISSGSTPSRDNALLWGGDVPWISAKDLKRPRVADSQLRLTSEGAALGKVAPANSVLILTRGMGLFKDIPVAYLLRDCAFNQDVKSLVPRAGLRADYLAVFLAASRHRLMNWVDAAGHGTGRLATDRLEALPVVVPDLKTQERIAHSFACWDDAIEGTDALIKMNRQRKSSLLRELISDGERYQLREVATILFSGVDKKTSGDERQVRLCNYTDVFNNERITNDLPFMMASASEREIDRFTLRRDDILFTKDSETVEEIAETAYVAEDLANVICGYHLAIARPDPEKVRGDFLWFALQHPTVRAQFVRLANGVVRFGLTLESMEQVTLHIPDLERQRRIASALSALVDEIQLLSKRSILLRQQKRGLLQKVGAGAWPPAGTQRLAAE